MFVLSQRSRLTSVPPYVPPLCRSSSPTDQLLSSSPPGLGPGQTHHCFISLLVPQVNQRCRRHTQAGQDPASPYGLTEKNLFLQDESTSTSVWTKSQGSPGMGPFLKALCSAGIWTPVNNCDWRMRRGHKVTSYVCSHIISNVFFKQVLGVWVVSMRMTFSALLTATREHQPVCDVELNQWNNILTHPQICNLPAATYFDAFAPPVPAFLTYIKTQFTQNIWIVI